MPIEIKLIDLNLLSGSTETTRTAFGSYYEVLSSSEGEYLTPVLYEETALFGEEEDKIFYALDAATELTTTISLKII